MSYLDSPRIVFTGGFQADPSTVNNDVRYFKNDTFQKQYQDLSIQGDNGGWNPEGTGIFRFIGCRITGAQLGNEQITSPAQDPIIGMAIENADDQVFGKIVDLDPQQQMVSQIWGIRLRLDGGGQTSLFQGAFAPAAFVNLWRRQQSQVFLDQALAAVYQSVLQDVVWSGTAHSKVLDALRAASKDGLLSINFNLYGYGRDPSIPRYTHGAVAGVIGPGRADEPKHFTIGRQMVAALKNGNPMVPQGGVYCFQCKVDEQRKILTADFGNCLEIVNAGDALVDIGPLTMAVLKTDTSQPLDNVSDDKVVILGQVNYRQANWYGSTAGVQEFDYSADPWCVANITSHPILLLGAHSANQYTVLVQESLGGFYVRADNFVCRLQPEQTASVALYASKYGKPFQGTVAFSYNTGGMGGTGAGDQPLNPPVPTPDIAMPADAIIYPAQAQCGADGKAILQCTVDLRKQPTPRGYIDGQLYGIGYQLTAQPAATITNFWNFVSVLAFSPFEAPKSPTWYTDIAPILTQYGHLYPIMSKHLVDLGDYDSVVKHLKILRLAFSLPIEDPNHMPVTRDLSEAKRAMILNWIDHPGADGLPLKGAPAAIAAQMPEHNAADPVSLGLDPLQTRGKSEVMLQFLARNTVKDRS
jgi:hypothetical protein